MTLPRSYFDSLYEGSGDPWGFRTRWYEQRKRALSMAALPRPRYGRVFEPGCSFGLLSVALAERAEAVLAVDISPAVLGAVGAAPPNVTFQVGAIPADWPSGHFDLVVMSEVGYYLDEGDWRAAAGLAVGAAEEILLVHWRHPVADYPLAGDDVHEMFGAVARDAGLTCLVAHLEEDLRMDVWSRDSASVATRTGVR